MKKIDLKAMPPTKSIQEDYEAQMAKLIMMAQDRAMRGDVLGQQAAVDAVRVLKESYQQAMQVGAMRDQFAAFKGSQPFGWR